MRELTFLLTSCSTGKVGPAPHLDITVALTLFMRVRMNWLLRMENMSFGHLSYGHWKSWPKGRKNRRAVPALYQLQHLGTWSLNLAWAAQ